MVCRCCNEKVVSRRVSRFRLIVEDDEMGVVLVIVIGCVCRVKLMFSDLELFGGMDYLILK